MPGTDRVHVVPFVDPHCAFYPCAAMPVAVVLEVIGCAHGIHFTYACAEHLIDFQAGIFRQQIEGSPGVT